MKRYIVKSVVAAVAATAAVGCAKFDNMNKNPYAVYDAPAESFVQPILYNTEYALVQRSYDLIAELMQYSINMSTEITSQMNYNYSITESVVASLWQNLYIQAGNAEYMLATAKKETNPAMKGVALVLRAMVMANIADTYGNVPYFGAAKIAMQDGSDIKYTTVYDELNVIYADLLRSLEEANRAFAEADELLDAGTIATVDFSPLCDYTYRGDAGKWRRFGNSLYLRLLMRVSLKVEEEGGMISLGDEYGELNVRNKIAELYDCFLSGGGDYPMMRSRADAALVEFSKYNSALYTPFYSTTSGIWNSVAACTTLVDKMYDKDTKFEDPRYYYYFTKPLGAPTQWLKSDLDKYIETHVSSAGNSQVGRYPRGAANLNQVGDLQNAEHYALMNYSELLFVFAEAGQRGWLNIAYPAVKQLYLRAVTESVLEWNDTVTEGSESVVAFLNTLSSQIDADNALETILTQKWISMFWVGTEAWCDYRRTGYPLLKTNGPAAENNCILPTRMRYPADEKYRNPKSYDESVNGWLGGTNNMQTDIWWASTAESRAMRLKGRR